MNDRPRVRRKDPERSAPIRDWSNVLRSPGTQEASARSADPVAVGSRESNFTSDGSANGSAAMRAPEAEAATVSEEARAGIEVAYRVIDEHLQEGRLAAQAQNGRGAGGDAGLAAFATAGGPGVGIAADSIQEMVTQGIRFYSSLAPLWAGLINSIAHAAGMRDAAADGVSAAPLAPPPMPRSAIAMSAAPVIVEIASTRMTRVTVNLVSHAGESNLAIGGLLALEPEKPPLKEIVFALEAGSGRTVVRIRVPESQPAGVYSGVIVDGESGEARGTMTLKISPA
jgi:hypothetical protein